MYVINDAEINKKKKKKTHKKNKEIKHNTGIAPSCLWADPVDKGCLSSFCEWSVHIIGNEFAI